MPLASACLAECHAQLSQQLDAYYDRTKLLAVVRQFVRELSQRFASTRLVPMNPFVPLLAHVRLAEISADELLLSPRPRDLKTLPVQELLIFDPRDGRAIVVEKHIATFKTQPPPALAVWGWRGVLERIPYSSEWQLAVEKIHFLVAVWLRDSEGTDEGYGFITTNAMVGSQLFFLAHRREPEPLVVDIERHVFVRGDQLEPAMTVFARQQIRFLFEATKKNAVMTPETGHELSLIGSSVIEITMPSSRGVSASTWTHEHVISNRQAFVTAVKMALVENGSFVIDLLYAFTSSQAIGESWASFVRVRINFLFHFDYSPPSTGSQPAVIAKPLTNTSSSRSFVKGSRVDFSGIFLSTRAAYEVTRRISDQKDRDAKDSVEQASVLQRGNSPIIDDVVHSVGLLARSSSELCHWMRILPTTPSFRLLAFVSLIDLTLHALHVVPPTPIRSFLGSTLKLFQDMMDDLVQDASIGRSSSQLQGLSRILRELCCLPEPSADPKYLDLLYQSLLRGREAITWLASASVHDFSRLVERTTSAESTSSPPYPCADLRSDISAAIDDRRFPPAVVVETVFAQYIVETRLDLALERSIASTVTSGLPPNPFVPFCSHLRAFAQQMSVSNMISRGPQQLSKLTVRQIDGMGFAVDTSQSARSLAKVVVSCNECLLKTICLSQVLAIDCFLVEREVYRSGPYHPSKATYSGRITTSILVDDPKISLGAEQLDGVLLQSIDLVEHVFIEGKDFDQALRFFADAVRRDVSRLLESHTDVELKLLDPVGELVSMVELRELQTFEQLLIEATPKLCNLAVRLPPDLRTGQSNHEVLIWLTTKTYVFHHQSTEGQQEQPLTISDRIRFRIRNFGLFLDSDAAMHTLAAIGKSDKLLVSEPVQTTYATRALRRDDDLCLSHLRGIVNGSPNSQPKIDLLHLLDMEAALEWLFNRLVYQQQTALTPRSEAVALVANAKHVLNQIVSFVERFVIPVVEAVGVADTRRVAETIESLRIFCGDMNIRQTDQAMQTAERLTLRLWTLVLLVRFSVQADLK